MHASKHGFTLVELSIVLVILGLLVGGVLTGQSLIRAAELRSVTTQEQRYGTAVQTFRDKYFALPGDMTNATAYWGTASVCPGDYTSPATTTATCNGNGDGQILSIEAYRFWQHLTNAGLLEGNYSGVPATSTTLSSASINSPAGRIGSTLWFAYNYGTMSGSGAMFDGNYGNTLGLGGYVAGGWPAVNILKPEELYNIDTKIDDGKPATGMLTIHSLLSPCSDTSTSSNLAANYNLSNSTAVCIPFFRNLF